MPERKTAERPIKRREGVAGANGNRFEAAYFSGSFTAPAEYTYNAAGSIVDQESAGRDIADNESTTRQESHRPHKRKRGLVSGLGAGQHAKRHGFEHPLRNGIRRHADGRYAHACRVDDL